MSKERKKNPLNVIQTLSSEFHEIHFPAREKVQEEALVITAVSIAASAAILAIDTISWQIISLFL